MVSVKARNRRRRLLRYAFGGAMLLLAGIGVLIGAPWYLSLIVAVAASGIIIGRRRIFRSGVSRSGDEIVCRYVPWYEGNAYGAVVLIPLMGVAMVGAGDAPGYPVWLRFGGIILLVLTSLTLDGTIRMWRRSLLRITPSALTVRLAERGSKLTDIRREQIASIQPKTVLLAYSEALQVAIAYQAADLGSGTKTVLLGLQLTVQPVDLLHALVAWKDGADENPSELLDRVEQLLRGRSTAGV